MVQQFPPLTLDRQLKSTVVTTPTGKNPAALKWLLLAFMLLVMAVMGLATVYMIGRFNTGLGGLLIGITMGMLPVPLYLGLAIWIDRFEPEPPLMLALTFLWGATGAVFIAFILNSLGAAVVAQYFGKPAAEFYGPSISAPLVEESAKALALFAIFFFRRNEFDGVLDGIVYAAMVGLGFAMTENFSYYGKAMTENAVIGSFTFLLRGGFLAFAHPLFTSMTGIGLGISVGSRNRAVQVLAPLGGLALAMGLHFFNNTFVVAMFAIGGPVLGLVGLLGLIVITILLCICVMVVAVFQLMAESRTVRAHLQPDVATGFLCQDDVDCLASVPRRMGASFSALSQGGYAGYRARARYNHIASELAFFRNRLARGLIARDANAIAQENEYRNALMDLRRQIPVR
jgi:RsiW-degrading membrane proteinase PrsW (M82 family)